MPKDGKINKVTATVAEHVKDSGTINIQNT